MSAYTDKMVAQLMAASSWNYYDCEAFADEYKLSTRSVISKVKSLGLLYVPKPKPVAKGGQVRKTDVVEGIATAVGVTFESVEGLAKADKRSLTALLQAVQ